MKIRLDLKGEGWYVSWEYDSDLLSEQVTPDIGSTMQVNNHRFQVEDVTIKPRTPRSKKNVMYIKGKLL